MEMRLEYKEQHDGDGVLERRAWVAIDDHGAVEIWACEHDGELYGGIEVHKATGEGEPSQDLCHLLLGPCWHDGSSYYFSKFLEPALVRGAGKQEMWRHCLEWHEKNIRPGGAEE